jgi:hypothetical protein
MDRGRPGRVVVAACDPTNDAQKWRCNATIHPLNSSKELGLNRDNQVVLDDYGATWDNADTFCKKMIEYKGRRLVYSGACRGFVKKITRPTTYILSNRLTVPSSAPSPLLINNFGAMIELSVHQNFLFANVALAADIKTADFLLDFC